MESGSGQTGRNWDNTSLASRWHHAFFYRTVRFAGLGPAKFCLFFVVLFFSLKPSIARRASFYLKKRFGPVSPPLAFAHVFKLYWSFACVLLERSAIGVAPRYKLRSTGDCGDTIQKLLGEGRGLIVLSAHAGAWQLALATLSKYARVNVIQPRRAGDVDRHFFEHASGEGKYPIAIIEPGKGFGGLLDAKAALERGEIVCIMGDRLARGEKLTARVDFMGEEAIFPGSPYALASITGSPAAVILTKRTGPCAIDSSCQAVIRVPPRKTRTIENIDVFAGQYARSLEIFVEENPYQFFNFHDLWAGGQPL